MLFSYRIVYVISHGTYTISYCIISYYYILYHITFYYVLHYILYIIFFFVYDMFFLFHGFSQTTYQLWMPFVAFFSSTHKVCPQVSGGECCCFNVKYQRIKNDKKGPHGCLEDLFGDETLPNFVGIIFINHEIRIHKKTTRIQWKVRDPFFFVRGQHGSTSSLEVIAIACRF